jgi:hypothetical protein
VDAVNSRYFGGWKHWNPGYMKISKCPESNMFIFAAMGALNPFYHPALYGMFFCPEKNHHSSFSLQYSRNVL